MSEPSSIAWYGEYSNTEIVQPTAALKFVGGILHQQFEILTYGTGVGLKARKVVWRPVPSEPGPLNEEG